MFAGERKTRRPPQEDSSADVSLTTKIAMSVSVLDKMLKDNPSTSLESRRVSAVSAAVPMSSARAKEDSSCPRFGYFIMLHNIYTVCTVL